MKTIGLIGFGAIGQYVAKNADRLGSDFRLSHVLAREAQLADVRTICASDTLMTADPAEFFADIPDIVIEAAGHSVVHAHGPTVLESGRELYLLSIGVLADDMLTAQLAQACRSGGGRILIPAGALAGFDGLMALSSSGLRRVRYTSRKPPYAWRGTPAADKHALDAVQSPTIVFEGSARDAARLYPKNANLAAAVALAGMGLDETIVTLIADPTIDENVGEIDAVGALGSLFVRVSGEADANNPKTSAIVGASVISALTNRASRISFI